MEFTTFAPGCGWLLVKHDCDNNAASITFDSPPTPLGVGQLTFDATGIAGIEDAIYYPASNKLGISCDPNTGVDQREAVGQLVNKIKQWGAGMVSTEQTVDAHAQSIPDPHREYYLTHEGDRIPHTNE